MICTICNNQLCNQMVGMSYSSILIGFLFYHRLFFFSRFFIAILKNFRLFDFRVNFFCPALVFLIDFKLISGNTLYIKNTFINR